MFWGLSLHGNGDPSKCHSVDFLSGDGEIPSFANDRDAVWLRGGYVSRKKGLTSKSAVGGIIYIYREHVQYSYIL